MRVTHRALCVASRVCRSAGLEVGATIISQEAQYRIVSNHQR